MGNQKAVKLETVVVCRHKKNPAGCPECIAELEAMAGKVMEPCDETLSVSFEPGMNPGISHRLGLLSIGIEFVEDRSIADVLAFLEFVPWRAECLLHLGIFSYMGTSPHFPECERGQVAPSFDITVTRDEFDRIESVELHQDSMGVG